MKLSKRLRFTLVLLGAAALAAFLGVAFLRSAWFAAFVRVNIVAATEHYTGGRVQLRSFSFDWKRLQARLDGFVIHGREPAGAPPLFQAPRLELRLALLPSLTHTVDLPYLALDHPSVNIIVFPDGSTNFPHPRGRSSGSPLESIVNLAIGRFNVTSGEVLFAARRFSVNVSGRDLRALLSFDPRSHTYQGRLSAAPLELSRGPGTPVPLYLDLPLLIDKEGLETRDARLTSAKSSATFSAALRHFSAPTTNLRLSARLAVDELRRALDLPLRAPAPSGPSSLSVDLDLASTPGSLNVASARLRIGSSFLNASGPLRDPTGRAGLALQAEINAAELSPILPLPVQLSGNASFRGSASLDAAWRYLVTGSLDAGSLDIRRGAQGLSGLHIASDLRLDPNTVALSRLHVDALGGNFDGALNIKNFSRWEIAGDFGRFSLAQLAHSFTTRPAGYDGILSGSLHAQGALKNPSLASVSAESRFLIAPAPGSLPLNGRIDAVFTGASRSIVLTDSYVSLPHSRADFSGALGKSVRLHVVTRDLDDFLPAIAFLRDRPASPVPIHLAGGDAGVIADVIGPLDAPAIAGRVSANHFSLDGHPIDRVFADIDGSASGTTWRNGYLAARGVEASFAGTLALHNWLPSADSALTFHASFQNASLPGLLALAGRSDIASSGSASAHAELTGAAGDPQGTLVLHAGPGSLAGQTYDGFDGTVLIGGHALHLTGTSLQTARGTVSVDATFHHPADSFRSGQIHLSAAATPLSLSHIQAVQDRHAGLDGRLQFRVALDGAVDASGASPRFDLSSLRGSLSLTGLRDGAASYGDFSAGADTVNSTVAFDVTSTFAGSHIRAQGHTRLAPGYPSSLTASIPGLPIEKVLPLIGYPNVPVEGALSAETTLNGSLNNLQGDVKFSLAHARLYSEPLDSVSAGLRFSDQLVSVESASAASPAGSVALSGSFRHPRGALAGGHLQLHLESGGLDLARIDRLQQFQPGLSGALKLLADLTGDVGFRDGRTVLLLSRLNAEAAATSLAVNRQPYGQAVFHAASDGPNLDLRLDSNFAGSVIHGAGRARLEGDYPIQASVSFSNVVLSSFQSLLGLPTRFRSGFDGAAEGNFTLNGPLFQPDSLKGSLVLSRFNLSSPRRNAAATDRVTVVANDGPIDASLERSVLRINHAHLTGRNSHLDASGSIAFGTRNPLNLSLDAAFDLAVLEEINRDVYAGGSVTLKTAIRGTFDRPYLDGRVELHDASLNLGNIPNGISNANGVIVLRGASANIQNLTGVTGGGKVTVAGSLDFSGGATRFGLKATADRVRVRYQGASVLSNSTLALSGTGDRSTLSGSVTVHRVAFNQDADLGSLLSITSTPVESPAPPSPLLSAIRLDVRVRTAPDVRFQTNYTQRLEADADLNLRGTLDRPSLLGRIVVTQGEVIFFGNRYTVNQGTINFYNALKIEPVLNISLETQAQGVDVVLGVSGPLDNMKLSYRSDPPLQFDEIVQLLALGSTPTSDATVIAHQPPPPQQSFGQMGESAIVGQAVASPLANRISRVFGISQLRVDPAFTTGSAIPLARVTLQQQVSSNILFTYTTDLTAGNSQLVRVEWAINPRYSAAATRDENGIVSFDIFYKKTFH